ncbi:MAG: hypothetical protein ABEH81_10840 [Halopenitus sp.]
MDREQPVEGLQDIWERVEDDLDATATEYREAGWDVTRLNTGDVTALPTGKAGVESDRVGLDALVPGDEFEALQDLVDDHTFDEYETYRGESSGLVVLVLAMLDTDDGVAVLLPLFYRTDEAEAWLDAAEEAGETHTYVRPLDDHARVVFSHEDPTAFFPAARVRGTDGPDGPDGADAE